MSNQEQEVRDAWQANASAWSRAVRSGAIGSRARVTDAAVINQIKKSRPRSILDLGCGEGWLCRALKAEGIDTVGIDLVPALIAAAAAADPDGVYHCLDYDQLSRLPLRVDAVIANFSLFSADLASTLAAVSDLVVPGGSLIIQTLHPWVAGTESYDDDWRLERFTDLDGGFPAASPWYFRTLSSWTQTFCESGWRLQTIQEPVDPATDLPASILFICTC